ncbi:MAG: outer membrane lipoprotein-sorting protein [Candidatus Acidiferrales bacterium]
MISKLARNLLALVCVVACVAPLCSSATERQARGSWSLDSILAQLDAEARDFHSLAADVERTKVTVVVNDRSTEIGTIAVRGDKMLLEMKTPDPRTILRNGDTLYVYTPGLKRVEEYNLGKNKSAVDQFLLLGFGTAGAELRKGYLITVLPETTVGDHKTVELELTPKSDAVRAQISKIEIWLDESTWLPVEQQFFETGSGDYSIVKYSKIVRNAPVPESDFKPHWPKGTEKIKPQG